MPTKEEVPAVPEVAEPVDVSNIDLAKLTDATAIEQSTAKFVKMRPAAQVEVGTLATTNFSFYEADAASPVPFELHCLVAMQGGNVDVKVGDAVDEDSARAMLGRLMMLAAKSL